MKIYRFLLFFVFVLTFHGTLYAQFYNGTQMTFGQNRVQYEDYFWRYLRFLDFDVYYDKEGRELADFVAKKVPLIMQHMSQKFEMNYSKRMIFIACNSLNDLKQTNIGLGSSIHENNIGGVTQIVDNKVVVYFNGDHNNLITQIKKGVAELYINDYLFGIDNYREVISNSAVSGFPDWFVQGFVEFASDTWNSEVESHIRYGLSSGSYTEISHLQGDDAAYAGLALWNYIAEAYGNEYVSNIVYLAGVIKEVNESFELLLGKSVSELIAEMNRFYSEKFNTSQMQSFGEKISLPFRLRNHRIANIAVSPDGTKLCFATHIKGRVDIWLYSFAEQKTTHVQRLSYKLNQITDDTYPSIAWHPSGKIVSFFFEDKGSVFLKMNVLETGEEIIHELRNFDKIGAFDYSQDGTTIVFSGVRRGQSDIYTYSIPLYKFTQITDSSADDLSPSFVDNDSKIVYVSNQSDNSEAIQQHYDVYIQSLSSDTNIPLTKNKQYTEKNPQEISSDTYIYMSNKTGIQSLFITKRDSVIRSVDTIIHYSYTEETNQISHLPGHILQYDVHSNQDKLSLLFFEQGQYVIYTTSLDELSHIKDDGIQETYYWKHMQFPDLQGEDSVSYAFSDDSLMQINYSDYHFDYELYPYSFFVDSVLQTGTINQAYKTSYVYETNFYVNQVVNQIDFGFMNSSYQKFSGYEFQYVPRLNIALKFGVVDLFEDYRLTGGARFYGDLNSNELLFSLENLKKRIDKQYIYHRQALLSFSENYSYNKTFDNHFKAVFSYPFDEAQSIRITSGFRFVQDIELSVGTLSSLRSDPVQEYWTEIKCEYVFDNTLVKGINLYNGTRIKVFAEILEEIKKSPDYLFVFGFDARHYQKIFRDIIFATRTAYSFSFGTSPLLYYLGGVDNWINLSLTQSKFNSSIEYDRNVDWTYQALGVNMRGFRQNIRNGPSFAVNNNELRIPIVKTLTNKPIASDFLLNFQIIGFFDVGGAWYGAYPGAKDNAYNYSVYQTGPVEVVVDEMRSAFVFGYGYGIRSRLYGYFIRIDWAYGKDYGETNKMVYLSLSLDF